MLPILCLHGALGAKSQLAPLAAALQPDYVTHVLDFDGHGQTPFQDTTFSIPVFANQVIAYLNENNLAMVHLFGYSMGGYVAMFLARHFPERVGQVITMATKYNWNEATAAKEVRLLHPATIQEKVPAFAAMLKERHGLENWEAVLHATSQMMLDLGKNPPLLAADYAAIPNPCMLMMGDQDNMVSFQETIEVYKTLPNARFAVLPATPHAFEKVDIALLCTMIQHFIS
jgi:pimeloyl-ACP methyl ester carboxylesterase